MSTYEEARKACFKRGTAHATGEALAALYAAEIALWYKMTTFAASVLYAYLRELESDEAIRNEGLRLLGNNSAACAAYMTQLGKEADG